MSTQVRKLLPIAALGIGLTAAHVAAAQELTIWHDKGDPGIAMIQRIADLYQKDHPNVTVKSISMPTDQWQQRSIAALNTNTAPDILFNDNDRMILVQKSTGKLSDLASALDSIAPPDRANLSSGIVVSETA